LSYTIIDSEEFGEEIIRALTAEEEDGTTLIHQLLDNAIVNAIEDGALGISEEPSVTKW